MHLVFLLSLTVHLLCVQCKQLLYLLLQLHGRELARNIGKEEDEEGECCPVFNWNPSYPLPEVDGGDYQDARHCHAVPL